MFDRAFASIATRVSTAFGGPYWPGALIVPGTGGGYDGDGVYQPGAGPARITCQVQVNDVTDYMRANEGYTDKDVSLLVIGTDAQVTSDMRVEIATGPRAGIWMVSTFTRDPAAVGWRIKARLA